jgi:hypothetical protein
MTSPAERDNWARFRGQKGRYEVWYLTLNHRASQTGAWIRYVIEAPLGSPARAELWFAHFDGDGETVAMNQRHPIASLSCEREPFRIAIDEAELGHGRARGELAGDGHQVSWNLWWTPAEHSLRLLPSVLYRGGGLGDTTFLCPTQRASVSGVIEVDGRRYVCDHEPGGQSHLWGRRHAAAWAWGHATDFAGSPDASLEVLTACLDKLGRRLPPLTVLSLALDGERLSWNRFRDTLSTSGKFATGRFQFSGEHRGVRVEGEFSCRPDDMVLAEYEDPDGRAVYCANSEIADLRVTVYRRGRGGRMLEDRRLVAPRAGHFEVGGRERDPAIGKAHRTI